MVSDIKILCSVFALSLVFNTLCILMLDLKTYEQAMPAILVISFIIGLFGPALFKYLYTEQK